MRIGSEELAAPVGCRRAAALRRWPQVPAILIGVAGFALFPKQLHELWRLWASDSLRSIGILMPPVSAWLCLRAWRGHRVEETDGAWWGLALVVAALAVAGRLSGSTLGYNALVYIVKPGAIIWAPLGAPGLILWSYASGVVLLLGGARAWRKARFGLALLLFVNPVPHLFTYLADLRLQYLGAHAARGFAGWLGVPVTGDALNLMFFDRGLGMFIAPGCNGLAGAAAMGYLALVIGHLYGLRAGWHALYVTGAVILGYLFNLIRLCALVLFYCLAARAPALGDYAVAADYLIGAALFTLAAAFALGIPRLGGAR